MTASPRVAPRVAWGTTWLTLAGVVAFVAAFVRVGADCYWLVAMGRTIAQARAVPDGIPFAAAPTQGWPNVVVLGELALAGLHGLGTAGLPAFQVLVDAAALVMVALAARRAGASDRATAVVLVLVSLGSLTSLVIVRAQTFSLVLFAVLILVLRAEASRPSRAVWTIPPLFALWSNLHGAVLVGVAVAGAYLVCSRLRARPRETVLVLACSLAAVLVTPAGLRTVDYYRGVLDNEAAARGTELWARPDLTQPFDVLLVAAAVLLLALALRQRRELWEYVALAGLAFGTVLAARHGVWLLMAAAAPAALGATSPRRVRRAGPSGPGRMAVLVVGALALTVGLVASAARGDATLPADPRLVSAVGAVAGDRVVLAPEPLVESLALAGVRVWVSDPIDAFRAADQAAYLDFLTGGHGAADAVAEAGVVVLGPQSQAQAAVTADGGLTLAQELDGWKIYAR